MEQAELFEQAVDAARRASSGDDYDAVFAALAPIAAAAPDAIDAAFDRLRTGDSVTRATACELVRMICNQHEVPRERSVEELLAVVAEESDADVLRAAAGALGATASPRALPALVALARHGDEDVRSRVALALPPCMVGNREAPPVQALIELTRDSDAAVRDWATFGLGRQLDFDSEDLRDALWARVADESEDVCEEAAAGLARRRDPRALPLVADLLERGDVPSWLFAAAASLADSSLVPLLLQYDQSDDGVQHALSWCDPERRSARERGFETFLTEAQRLLDDRSPCSVIAMWCELLDMDVLVHVTDLMDDGRVGAADHMIAAANGDPVAAARRWVDLIIGSDEGALD